MPGTSLKESDITLEPTLNYTRDGINLYLYNRGNTGNAIFYNVTVHGYLVKTTTVTPTARIADEDISGGEPQTNAALLTEQGGYILKEDGGKILLE